MKDDLKAIFESAVLTDETKAVLQEAFDAAVSAKEVELREQFEQTVADEVKQLSESAQEMIEEAIADHLEQFADEIAHARTLEVQYADKLEMFKESFAERNNELISTLVAESVAEEITELKESIEEAKQIKFALHLFESFRDTYAKLFGGEESVAALEELKEAKAELDSLKRAQKIAELTESLVGSKKKVAETVLESVAFDKLEERFESIKHLLVAESKEEKDEDAVEEMEDQDEMSDEDKAKMKEGKGKGKAKMVKEGVVVIEESESDEPVLTEKQRLAAERIRKSLRAIR